MYRKEFMDSMRLSAQFKEAQSGPPQTRPAAPSSTMSNSMNPNRNKEAQTRPIATPSTMSDFMKLCRNNDVTTIQKIISKTSPATLSIGLSAAITERHAEIVSCLTPHTQVSRGHLQDAIKANASELIDILDPTSEITQKHSKDLMYDAIMADSEEAVSMLAKKGATIDTSSHGHIYKAGMSGRYSALKGLLQNVCYFETEDTIIKLQSKHASQAIDTLDQAKAKQKLLETLHQYKMHSRLQGTAPARPTSSKVRAFTTETIAKIMNGNKPILTQRAVDDFQEKKYAKKQEKHGRNTPF